MQPFLQVRGGLIVHSVLLSVLLVVATAFAVAVVVVQSLSRQVEDAADRRLVAGAAFLQSQLQDSRDTLSAVGGRLTFGTALAEAAGAGSLPRVAERLAPALSLPRVDELIVADLTGNVLIRARKNQPPQRAGNLAENVLFQRASQGATVSGMSRDAEGVPQQELYLPIRAPDAQRPVGVLVLAAQVDQGELDAFRRFTGLDASLFVGQERVATTVRLPSGAPVTAGADVQAYQEAFGSGRELHIWRELPVGRVRTYYAPVSGSDGSRVGVLSVSIPANAILGEQAEALRPALAVTLLVTILGATLTYALARRVRQPVLVLAASAARLRQGDTATPIPLVREPTLAPLAEELERARSTVHRHLQALAAEEARQRALFSALHEPIIVTAQDARVTAFNPAAAALFGAARYLYGKPIIQLLPFVDPSAAASREPTEWYGRLDDVAGRALDLEVSRAPLPEGRADAAWVYVAHVSRHAELSRLREQLLHNVAHELRAPLAVLENALEIAASDYGELSASDFDRLMRTARRTARRLRALMEDMLSAGSIQAGRLLVTPRPIQVGELLQEALEVVRLGLAERRQQVQESVDLTGFTVYADRRYARQVLSNLLANASKYSPEEEVIRVGAEAAGDQVRVTVEDKGPGIPPEQQARLFERFYRVRPGNEEPGIGLGLAIVKGIVEAHGGTVGVESQPGQGTRVWFTLPAANGQGRE